MKNFKSIYCFDFEFYYKEGEKPSPHCVVFKNITTGEILSYSGDKLKIYPEFLLNEDNLFIAYFASAEISCLLELNWPNPKNLIDLFVEFRNMTNGKILCAGNGLLGACKYFNIPTMREIEKEENRNVALSGETLSHKAMLKLITYCTEDVLLTEKLFGRLFPLIDNVDHALIHGNYMKAVAKIERNGIPINAATLNKLIQHEDFIKSELIKAVDAKFGVYENGSFKLRLFKKYISENNLGWPLLETSGKPKTDKDTFKSMSNLYPEITDLKELKKTLGELKLYKISVGKDHRNRALLSPFASKTGRNQPSNAKFIFGSPKWARFLITPEKDTGLAYIDFGQQEFGIAAALSKDDNMKQAYLSGDPYLYFAYLAGAVPKDATKDSHVTIRDQYKNCALAVQYGMGAKSLAYRIGLPVYEAEDLLLAHKKVFKKFWEWSDRALDYVLIKGSIHTAYGWTLHLSGCDDEINDRSLRNFPMQANATDILRLSLIFCDENNIKVCAPVHDAILIEAPTDRIHEAIKITQKCMVEAGKLVLEGFELKTDVEIFSYPNHYFDKKGEKMWNIVLKALENIR